MNRVVKPQTAMNDPVTVFAENEQGREAADHSADVINGDTAFKGYTNMTNIIVRSHVTTSHLTHHKPKEENTKKKFLGRVLGPDEPDRRNLTTSHITHHCISPDIRQHISPHHTLQAERREHREEVLGPSSWAGWLTTPHHTSHIHISPHQASRAGKYENQHQK